MKKFFTTSDFTRFRLINVYCISLKQLNELHLHGEEKGAAKYLDPSQGSSITNATGVLYLERSVVTKFLYEVNVGKC